MSMKQTCFLFEVEYIVSYS